MKRFWDTVDHALFAVCAAGICWTNVDAGHYAFGVMMGALCLGLAAMGAWGYAIERRRRVVTPDPKHEARLLAAMTDNGIAFLIDYDGDAVLVDAYGSSSPYVHHLGFGEDEVPASPGLHIWEGRCVESESPFLGDVKWLGSWRRATPEEAQRYAAGESVWGRR